MKTQSIILLALSTALLPLATQAKPDGTGPKGKDQRPSIGEIFQRHDADQSGTLSKEEVKGPLAKNFDRIDADADGEITKAELAKAHQQMAEKRKERMAERGERFKEMDADSSGTLSKEEAGPRLLKHFDKIDTDGNGELSKSELQAMRQKMSERRKGPPTDDEV